MDKTLAIGGATGLVAFLLGLPWNLILVYTIILVLDIVLGILKSMKSGEFKSNKMSAGLLKKCAEIIVLLTCFVMQYTCISLGIPAPIGNVLVGAFIFKEFASIIENYTKMGFKLPNIVKKWFKDLDG